MVTLDSVSVFFRRMPNGGPESTLHLAITDETGNTAVLEYLDGKLSIHEGKVQ